MRKLPKRGKEKRWRGRKTGWRTRRRRKIKEKQVNRKEKMNMVNGIGRRVRSDGRIEEERQEVRETEENESRNIKKGR